MGFKIGDIVKVRSDLISGTRYGSEIPVPQMERYFGKCFKILEFKNGFIRLKGTEDWDWSNEMLEDANYWNEQEESNTDINPKVELHRKICKEMTDLYERKNHDYGDSFAKMHNEFDNAILVRIYDKYSRLKTLKSGKTAKVQDESINDTLRDLANYCIMELIEIGLKEG